MLGVDRTRTIIYTITVYSDSFIHEEPQSTQSSILWFNRFIKVGMSKSSTDSIINNRYDLENEEDRQVLDEQRAQSGSGLVNTRISDRENEVSTSIRFVRVG